MGLHTVVAMHAVTRLSTLKMTEGSALALLSLYQCERADVSLRARFHSAHAAACLLLTLANGSVDLANGSVDFSERVGQVGELIG